MSRGKGHWIWRVLPWRCSRCGTRYGPFSAEPRTVDGRDCFCGQLAAPIVVPREARPMGSGPQPPIQSPFLFYRDTDLEGREISITLRFDNTTRLLLGADVNRDPGCTFTRILIGVGPDGSPETTLDQFVVPDGFTVVTALQLRRNGLNTLENVTALQVTAGR